VRPLPDAVWVFGDDRRERRALAAPAVPRAEVIDELHAAVCCATPPLHDGAWARATLEACLALLESARSGCDVELHGGNP
jgi:phthalate 4,5-cis-dihydrodiol dehydrogenase